MNKSFYCGQNKLDPGLLDSNVLLFLTLQHLPTESAPRPIQSSSLNVCMCVCVFVCMSPLHLKYFEASELLSALVERSVSPVCRIFSLTKLFLTLNRTGGYYAYEL